MKKAFSLIIFSLILILSLIFSVFAEAMSSFDAIADNTVRVHIKANSDSKEDQDIKIMVKDRILEEFSDIFSASSCALDTCALIEQYKEDIEKTADDMLSCLGVSYKAKVYLSEKYFKTKEYGKDLILPAGTYKALCVDLGNAEGENFWCVLFPKICLSASNAAYENSLPENISAITRKNKTAKVRLKFKTIELINSIKNKLRS